MERPDGSAHEKIREPVNLIVMLIMLAGYALTFMVPKFYGATDRYVGVFVFGCLAFLFLNNVDILSLLQNSGKSRRDFFLLLALLLLTLINLLLVNSGLGAFFVTADFILIFYTAPYIRFSKQSILILSAAFFAVLMIWFFLAYPKLFADYAFYGYNTNTGATFTIYTLLTAFLFTMLLAEKYRLAELLMTILMVKGLQLALWHRARGAFIMLLVFMLLWFLVPKKWWRKKSFYYGVWTAATLGSLCFVALYIAVGATGVNFRLPFFYKDIFSGRDKIWYEFFTLFIKKPLTGIGTNVTIESFFEFNVHNAMYNFLVIDGILVFLGILYLIFRFAAHAFQYLTSPLSLCALTILLAVFFESFFDVDLIWADYSLNLLFLCVVICHGEV
ncbi:MAG: hypothetical protein K6G83_11300 [Lachnospiraceae bacterium]|nr:hypothetical protein [Lachnospiraceae bacterium]